MNKTTDHLHAVFVTNIPTPYRTHMFNTMFDCLPSIGISFKVLYMAHTEYDRNWEIRSEDLDYDYSILPGIHPVIRDWTAHVNPGILKSIRSPEPDIVIQGGFAFPTNWLCQVLAPRDAKKLMIVESNLDSTRLMGTLARAFKRFMLRSNDGFIVPGDRSRDYILSIDPDLETRPFIRFPNLIDERIYVNRVDQLRSERKDTIRSELQVPEDDQLWFCPARLIEEKGLDVFLPCLSDAQGIVLAIAGDGRDRSQLSSLISRMNIPARILGNCSQGMMLRLYANSDVFVLPSLRDPSPLSAVEGCAAGLPLLVSKRIGNLTDVLEAGRNGWTFDPANRGDLKTVICQVLSTPIPALRAMGRESRLLYESNFDSRRCVLKLGESLLRLGRGT